MIRLLDQQVAGIIAAGEVIDRPYSIVRELLDNALDAGAGRIEVEVESGGLGLVAVRDDGHGIARADLERVALRHATSKISTEHDLERLTTLGFRGEALASIAACARLELTTRSADAAHASRLVAAGARRRIGSVPAAAGTRVQVTRLFADLPARRRFLRRPGAETAMCRRAMLEKALAHPQVTFRFAADGAVSLVLPATTPLQRVADALGNRVDPGDLASAERTFADFAITVIGARPELAGRDRTRLQVFVNRRRIQEYALLQAVEYGYAGIVPGGRHPVACLFVEIVPHLVDFNVHPAKREVRFRHLPPLHQAVARVAQELTPRFGNRSPLAAPGARASFSPAPAGAPPPAAAPARPAPEPAAAPAVSGAPAVPAAFAAEPPETAGDDLHYLGQALGVFLLVEIGGKLYFVDQHAAHERVLYEDLCRRAFPIQRLLLPIELELNQDEVEALQAACARLEELGIVVEAAAGEGRSARIVALAEPLHQLPADWLAAHVAGLRGVTADLQRAAFANVACKLAVKDGELLDAGAAREILRRSFAIDLQHCPHGRPLWLTVTREQLLHGVGR